MKTQVQNPPAVSSTVIRLVFLGGIVLGCVYVIISVCATLLKSLG